MQIIAAEPLACEIAYLAEKQHDLNREWKTTIVPNLRAKEQTIEANHRSKPSKQTISKAKADIGRGNGSGDVLGSLGIELQNVKEAITREPVLYVSDCTRKTVAKHLRSQPNEALAVISAEARGVVSVLQGRYSASGKTDEDVFLAGYSCDPHSSDRKTDGRRSAHAPCLTLVWALQPDAWDSSNNAANLTESGLLARFVFFDSHAEAEDFTR